MAEIRIVCRPHLTLKWWVTTEHDPVGTCYMTRLGARLRARKLRRLGHEERYFGGTQYVVEGGES